MVGMDDLEMLACRAEMRFVSVQWQRPLLVTMGERDLRVNYDKRLYEEDLHFVSNQLLELESESELALA